MSKAGTLEQLARELARLFEPLAYWVSNEREFENLLNGLSLQVNNTSDFDTLRASAVPIANAINTLLPIIDQFAEAVAADPVDEAVVANLLTDLYDAIDDITETFPGFVTAIQSVSGSHADIIASEILPRLLDLLLIYHSERTIPLLHRIFRLLGIFDIKEVIAVDTDPFPTHMSRRINYSRVGELLDPSVSLGERLFGWGTADFDPAYLFEVVSDLALSLHLPVIDFNDGEPVLQVGAAQMRPRQGGLDLVFDVAPDISQFELKTRVPLDFSISADAEFTGVPLLEFRPGSAPRFKAAAGSSGNPISAGSVDMLISYPKAADQAEPVLLLGKRGGSRFQAERFELDINGAFRLIDGDVELHPGGFARVLQGEIVIELGEGDGFIQNITGGGSVGFAFDFGLGYSPDRGIYILDGMGLELRLPMHLQLGPIKLSEIILGLSAIEEGIRIEASTVIGGDFGILQFAVERIGMNADLLLGQSDDKPVDFELGFRPPMGIGAVVDASAVSGGGYLFFDHERGEYAGVLELSFAGLTLQAIGLLSTQTPEGDNTFSFLAIITVQFNPGLQLGYGFSLNGVGGILGIHRSTDVDVLRDGLRNGTMGSILFPEDPVANAPQLLQDLRSIFPSVEGRHLFGPVLAIGWGTPISIIEIQLGVVIELPAPVRVLLLGRIIIELPHKDLAIAQLNLDLLGVFDSGRKEISIDASLYDSFVGVFALSGDMAMRLRYGDNPLFLVSIGGYHPRFVPPPEFPDLRRLALALGSGNNPRIRLEAYTAITSNTFQIGAAVDLYASKSGFSVEGGLSFDALFQFDPFYFIVDFRAYLSVKRGNTNIMSVGVQASLSGISPWQVRGVATIEVLFLSFDVSFNKTFGDSAPSLPESRVNVTTLLLEQLSNPANWDAALPEGADNQLIAFRDVGGNGGSLLAHPLGKLTVLQKVVPLGITIEKYGDSLPESGNHFTLDDTVILGSGNSQQILQTQTINEHFAPAHFFELSDDEKISRPSFEQEEAGCTFAGGIAAANGVSRILNYEEKIIDRRQRQRYSVWLTGVAIGDSAIAAQSRGRLYREEITRLNKSAESFFSGRSSLTLPVQNSRAPDPVVSVREPAFVVANATSLTAVDSTSSGTKGSSYTRALSDAGAINSTGDNQTVVLESFELTDAGQFA